MDTFVKAVQYVAAHDMLPFGIFVAILWIAVPLVIRGVMAIWPSQGPWRWGTTLYCAVAPPIVMAVIFVLGRYMMLAERV